MVKIDSGARVAAGGVLALAGVLSQLQLAAPAWPPTPAAHLEGRLQSWLSRAQQAKLVCVSSRCT